MVVDEWHELLGNKRGVMTSWLARLRLWNPENTHVGIVGDAGNIDEGAGAAVTLSPALPGERENFRRVVKGVSDKKIMDTLIRPMSTGFPGRDTWAVMLDHAIEAIESSRSTLVFTNVRSQAETWYHGLLEARPEWAGLIGLHHGSLDGRRAQVGRERLKEGS